MFQNSAQWYPIQSLTCYTIFIDRDFFFSWSQESLKENNERNFFLQILNVSQTEHWLFFFAGLGSRVPLKKQRFHMRTSLAPSSRKPPSHTRTCMVRVKWTDREEKEFYKAVQLHGVGQWSAIRRTLKTSRSNMQLKDKWRTICSSGYHQLCQIFGPVVDSKVD